jgi:hypothetical protein
MLTIVLIFLSNFSFAQTEKDDYEIYSLILNDRLENWFKNNFDKIVLISQYKDKFDQDIETLSNFTADSLNNNQIQFLCIISRPLEFAFIFKGNLALRKLVVDITSDFNNHPTIKSELLKVGKTKIQTITSEKYYSYFGKKLNKFEKAWKEIKREYGTNVVIELSKIKYLDNYATAYYDHHCGGLCGAGRLVFLEKANGKWKKIGEFNLWDS